ncbi:MAG: hypothetical protein P8X57_04235, partial [Cyclobacteriaceae bacterium]
MDKEIILYIVFLIIALLGRFLGGKKNQKKAKRPQPQAGSSDEPVKSFEELLEEFTSGKRQSAEPHRDLEEMDVPASVESRRRRKSPRELIEDDEDVEEPAFSFDPEEKLRSIDELVDIEKVITTSSIKSVEEQVILPVA